jgi:membrane protein
MMFKWLPDARVDWYDVWLGAILTTVFFEIGKLGIGFYIGKQGLESALSTFRRLRIVDGVREAARSGRLLQQ